VPREETIVIDELDARARPVRAPQRRNGKIRHRLVLFAVVGLTGLVAALATAGAASALPEWVQCTKVKKTGAYEDSACSTPSGSHTGNYEVTAPTHKCAKAKKVGGVFQGAFDDKECTVIDPSHHGEFEFKAGVGAGKPFTVGGEVVLRFADLAYYPELTMRCSRVTGEGYITGSTTVAQTTLVLSRCRGPFNEHEECASQGAPIGTIKIGPVSGELEYRGSAGHAVGLLIRPEGVYFTSFNCEYDGLNLRLGGSWAAGISGEQTTEFGKSFELGFEESGEIPASPTYEWGYEGKYAEPHSMALEGALSTSGEVLMIEH
jgi:hypothetical protein